MTPGPFVPRATFFESWKRRRKLKKLNGKKKENKRELDQATITMNNLAIAGIESGPSRFPRDGVRRSRTLHK